MIYFNTKPEVIESVIQSAPANAWVGEFSGRDSVAAIMAAFEDEACDFVLPVASFAGTEFGDTRDLLENHSRLKAAVEARYGEMKTLGDLVFYSDPYLWGIINGRHVAQLNRQFGFYSPCIGCHAYFHLIRLPFARRLGHVIISGERESHDGRVKLNQLPLVLDFLASVIEAEGVRLLQPIRTLKDGAVVENLIGWDWKEGVNHPACTFSGNYMLADGSVQYDPVQLKAYLQDYLAPIHKVVAEALGLGFEYDRQKLEAAVKALLKP
ncbi:hypothetical protein [Acidaminobacter hydrogenoformans]|uniref:Uncharacterized protein n=1 Tax=Acidaminobacter hydrogenoformans DSM 2784 TaxID=1120920 RepID=A0A1G5RS14_9FIRM|nr:hypothetical protein [Acidaminobacter hydrogenoformans]SCZ76221.1 hypothetical protein SAMN03080599_00129 [Acidaminobacter hydrogenoformans DSM 2784]